jgi:hypothetical protein
MSNKIGVQNALKMLGVDLDQPHVDPYHKEWMCRMCVQGVGQHDSMKLNLGLVIGDIPMLDINKHELWVGKMTFTLYQRFQDNAGTLLGRGTDGLATDGGWHTASYDTVILDRMKDK